MARVYFLMFVLVFLLSFWILTLDPEVPFKSPRPEKSVKKQSQLKELHLFKLEQNRRVKHIREICEELKLPNSKLKKVKSVEKKPTCGFVPIGVLKKTIFQKKIFLELRSRDNSD